MIPLRPYFFTDPPFSFRAPFPVSPQGGKSASLLCFNSFIYFLLFIILYRIFICKPLPPWGKDGMGVCDIIGKAGMGVYDIK